MAKKKNVEFMKETDEEKQARWNKNQKAARSFAKQAGLYKKAIAERKRNKLTEDSLFDD